MTTKNLLLIGTLILLTGCGSSDIKPVKSVRTSSKGISSDIDTHKLDRRGRLFGSYSVSPLKSKATDLVNNITVYNLILESDHSEGSFDSLKAPENLIPRMIIPAANMDAFKSLLQNKLASNLNKNDLIAPITMAGQKYLLSAYASINGRRVISIKASEGEFNFLEKDVHEIIRRLDAIKAENDRLLIK